MNRVEPERQNYLAVLSGKDGAYRFHIRELGIIASGADVSAAHRELERKRQAVFDEFAAAGLTSELPPPRLATDEAAGIAAHKGFVIRTLIVTAAALVIVFAATLGTRSVVTAGLESLTFARGGIHLKLVEERMINALHRIADPRNEFSKEKQEKVIESLRVIVKRYRPFLNEVRPLFSVEAADGQTVPGRGQ